ncbi:MAG: hypothetical protein SCK28_10280 [Bacillota bacterium]|nr:hypothetical protein [Bacillota bacterium]
MEFERVIKEIYKFIKPVYNAIRAEEEFLYQWDSNIKEWKKYAHE